MSLSDNIRAMVRTQISLTEEQMAALRELADRRGESIASIIREAVDATLEAEGQRRRLHHALEAVAEGGFASGHKDIAVNHDAYLAEDFLE